MTELEAKRTNAKAVGGRDFLIESSGTEALAHAWWVRHSIHSRLTSIELHPSNPNERWLLFSRIPEANATYSSRDFTSSWTMAVRWSRVK